MYQVISTQTRPNTNVEFFTKDLPSFDQDYLGYFRNTYIASGKFLNVESVLSVDSLTLTTTAVWLNEGAYTEFNSDPYVQSHLITFGEEYMASNNIVRAIQEKGDI